MAHGLHFLSPQPGTSLHCKTTDMGLVSHGVPVYSPVVVVVVIVAAAAAAAASFMLILQFSSEVSPCSDATPSGTLSHHVPGILTTESSMRGSDAGGSDASQSSREQTDASSVDSLDVPSAEKPRSKSKNLGLRSLKDTVVATIYQKRKSVTTPTTLADDLAPSGKSPETLRRCSAPYERPSGNKLFLPAPTRLSERSIAASKSPNREKRLLHICKSDGEGTSPTEDESHITGRLDMVDGGSRAAPQTAPVLLHKPDGIKLLTKMNRKIRTCLQLTSRIPDRQHPVDRGDAKVHVVDLSSEDVPATPSVLALTYSELLQLGRSL